MTPSGDVQRLEVNDVALNGNAVGSGSIMGNSASQKTTATHVYQKSRSLQGSSQKQDDQGQQQEADLRLHLAHPFSENQSNCPKTSPFPSQSETKYKTSTKTDDKQYPDTYSQASHGGQGQALASKAQGPMTRSFQAVNDHHLKKKLQIQKLTTQLDVQSLHLQDQPHVKGLAAGSAHRSQSQKALLIKQLL